MTDSKSEALLRAGCGSCSYNDRSIILIGGKRDNVCFKDCWMYDVSSQLLELLSEGPTEFSGRHHHSVTLVHDTVWVIGGINVSDVLGDCWCFHVSSRKWNKPELTGDVSLLLRGAHGACLYPKSNDNILLFGGYTRKSGHGVWLNDLVLVNTISNRVQKIDIRGLEPVPRGYHCFTAVGRYCVSTFGRTKNSSLIPQSHALAVFDTETDSWIETKGEGDIPQVRSSHRSCLIGGHWIAVFGGIPDSRISKDRINEMSVIKVTPSSKKFTWKSLQVNSLQELPGRAAHVQESLQNSIFVVGGYIKAGNYAEDIYKFQFRLSSRSIQCLSVSLQTLMPAQSFVPESQSPDTNLTVGAKRAKILHDIFSNDVAEQSDAVDDFNKHHLNSKSELHQTNQHATVDWQKEFLVADKNWKVEAENCTIWKKLASEANAKVDKLVSRIEQLQNEKMQFRKALEQLCGAVGVGYVQTMQLDMMVRQAVEVILSNQREKNIANEDLRQAKEESKRMLEISKNLESMLASKDADLRHMESQVDLLIAKTDETTRRCHEKMDSYDKMYQQRMVENCKLEEGKRGLEGELSRAKDDISNLEALLLQRKHALDEAQKSIADKNIAIEDEKRKRMNLYEKIKKIGSELQDLASEDA